MSSKVLLETQVCYPGSTIKGKLLCEFKKTTLIRAIRIFMTGMEHTKWYEDGVVAHRYITHITPIGRHLKEATRKFYKQCVIVHAGGIADAGCHEYDFTIELDNNLATTYNGPYGFIQYIVKGRIDYPEGTNAAHEHLSMECTILNLKDFSDLHKYSVYIQNPVSVGTLKTMFSLFCNGGGVNLQLNLDKAAFLVGETVIAKLCLRNDSHIVIKSFVVELIETVAAAIPWSLDRTKCVSKPLARKEVLLDQKWRQDSYYYEVPIEIPTNMIVYNFNGCRLWHVAYILKATCMTCSNKLLATVKAKLTLGYKGLPERPQVKDGLLLNATRAHGSHKEKSTQQKDTSRHQLAAPCKTLPMRPWTSTSSLQKKVVTF